VDFAIIETGGKQHKITPDAQILTEKIEGAQGDKITFDKVLMVVEGEKVTVGNPYIEGMSLEAEVIDQEKGKKIRILRFRNKSRHRRLQGHRQSLTRVSLKSDKSQAKKEVKDDKKTAVKKESKPKAVKPEPKAAVKAEKKSQKEVSAK
jgi:large subunit ribosomal protein L21